MYAKTTVNVLDSFLPHFRLNLKPGLAQAVNQYFRTNSVTLFISIRLDSTYKVSSKMNHIIPLSTFANTECP